MFSLTHNTVSIASPMDETVKLAVIADTHCTRSHPDLHPSLLPSLKEILPNAILHCGDISIADTLTTLDEIAPTYAVCGNRDYAIRPELPFVYHVYAHSVHLLFTHGHGTFFHYLTDKFQYMTVGFRFERYRNFLESLGGDPKVLIFGHTHTTVNRWVGEKLFFNPGAVGTPNPLDPHPSFGLITIQPDQKITAEIKYLID